MTLYEATLQRHSVRQYQDRPLTPGQVDSLLEMITSINVATGLHVQLVTNEPKAFQSRMAKYGKFSNVGNYIVMACRPGDENEENVGYHGERLVLLAQTLGLNTCWVGLTYQKVDGAFSLEKDEDVVCVIALGYGVSPGPCHKSRKIQDVSNVSDDSPEWFRRGVECALNAPTAVNQQKFFFELAPDGSVKASPKMSLIGYTKVDLGIAKLHFEIGAQEAGMKEVRFVR